MPALHVTEQQRAWLERFASAYHITWLYRIARLERPDERGLPITRWPPPPRDPSPPDA